MAFAAKPIKLTQVDAEDYVGLEPQPFLVVGPIPGEVAAFDLTAVSGYDATKTQTLTNALGVIAWVTVTP